MQASQKFVNLAYYCRYPTKQLSPFNIYSTTFLLNCPLLLAYHTFNLHCSVFKVRPFRSRLSLKPDSNIQTLWTLESVLNEYSFGRVIRRKISLWKLSLPSFFLERKKVVGQSGLEPPTSRLSVVCSSQLSYWPVLVEVTGLEPVTPCLQSRCSTSWAKPPDNVCPLN